MKIVAILAIGVGLFLSGCASQQYANGAYASAAGHQMPRHQWPHLKNYDVGHPQGGNPNQ